MTGATEGPATITARRAAWFLALSILVLGSNWPVMKIVMRSMTPLWFSGTRMIISGLVFGLVLLPSGRLRIPARRDMPVVWGLGIFSFGVMALLSCVGIALVGASRSAILVYTNSIWVAIGAILFLGERMSRGQIVGMAFGLTGLAVLFNPAAFDWNSARVVFGNLSIVVGAMVWAISMLQMRGHQWKVSPLELLPFQCVIGGIFTLPFAAWFEGPVPHVDWNWEFIGGYAYAVVPATCLAFWWLTAAARRLPAIAVSLAQLATPLIGVVASVIVVGEHPGLSDILGLVMIIGGVALAAILGRTDRARAQRAEQALDTPAN